jgi:hypothetical protein
MPNLGGSRPGGARPQMNRPNMGGSNLAGGSRPQKNRPSGGFNPSRDIASSRPGAGGMPSLGNRPGSSLPDFGGSRGPGGISGAGNRMDLASRPGLGDRPGINNNFPGAANRPGIGDRPGISNLPANRPGIGDQPGIAQRPGINNNLPGAVNRPGAGERPSAGDLGDFLGMDRPLRPDGGIAMRPGAGGDGFLADNRPLQPSQLPARPGQGGGGILNDTPLRPGDRPSQLPARPGQGGGGIQDDRPLRPDRPLGPDGPFRPDDRPFRPDNRPGQIGDNFVNRPIDIGKDFNFNTNINYRPQWANIDNNRINGINNNWQSAIAGGIAGGLGGWASNYPNRLDYWNGWGDNIRDNWSGYYHNDCFGPDWWQDHYHDFGGWSYAYSFPNYDYSYWYSQPAWQDFSSWFSVPAATWSEPIYYDYGQGGNVVYEDNSVYVAGQQVATAEEFAESAAALATVAPPANEDEAAKVQWMPLGTFAVSTSQKETEPPYTMQLAVSKEGIISGTFYNTQNDKAYTVQGQVDKETQRVAFRIGGSEAFVAETGLYNLIQNEAPLLVHFGAEKNENWLLVRMEQPEGDQG